MHVAKLLKKSVGIKFLMSALVVVNNLVRLVLTGLDCHAISEILRLVILTIADVPTKHHLTHRINDYIDLCGAHFSILVLVVEVQLRAVAIPQRITLRWECRAVLASKLLSCCLLTMHSIVPLWHNRSTVQPSLHTAKAFQWFPAVCFCLAVCLFKELRIGVDRNPATLQCDE